MESPPAVTESIKLLMKLVGSRWSLAPEHVECRGIIWFNALIPVVINKDYLTLGGPATTEGNTECVYMCGQFHRFSNPKQIISS